MSAIQYWTSKFDAEAKTYECPWCARALKGKLSNSAKNPGKTFVSCSKDFGGCGLFCFLDVEPNEKFNPNKKQGVKRSKSDGEEQPQLGGNNIIGPIVNQPDVVEVRLAELAAKIDGFASQQAKVVEGLAEILDYLKQ